MAYQCELDEGYQTERAAYEETMTAWKDLRKQDRGERPRHPEQPPCYVTSDAMVEAVGELLADNPRGLLVTRYELDAWFRSSVRYKGQGGGTDRPHWLELHRAGTLRLDRLTRKRRSLTVRRASCSITGTIQPQVLASALDDDAPEAGLGARFLLAMAPGRKRRWTEAEVHDELADRYNGLLKHLLTIPLADATKRQPHVFALSSQAKELWVHWFERWGDAKDAAEGEHAAAMAKLKGYAARLALLHHVVSLTAADESGLVIHPITDASLAAAITLVEWFAGEAVRVYTILRETAEERECRRLVQWIEARGGSVYPRDLQRANARRWSTSDHAGAVLDLVSAGFGEWRDVPPGQAGGRPGRVF